MSLIKRIKQMLKDREFNKKLGSNAELKDIQARAYNEEFKNLMKKRAETKGKLQAHRDIKYSWKRRKFKRETGICENRPYG